MKVAFALTRGRTILQLPSPGEQSNALLSDGLGVDEQLGLLRDGPLPEDESKRIARVKIKPGQHAPSSA